MAAATLDLQDPSLIPGAMRIGPDWAEASAGATIEVVDPADGRLIGRVPDATASNIEAAISAAAAALPGWRALPAMARAELLERWHRLILANERDLARILTGEQGKPLAEALGEIRYAASFVKWFAEGARRIESYGIASPSADRRILALREPVGVCAAITPWNFPAAMITRKCAPALAAGCTLIVKPSELTPLTALALAKLAERAEIPPGVINVVTGNPTMIGDLLTASDVVRKLSFTGSTRVGALLMRQSADTLKRVSLELGGNAPFLVFDDADLDSAVAGAMASKFRNAGQTCVCANRFLVQAGIYDRFVERLAAAVQCLRVGPGTEEGVEIGPLINTAAVEKVVLHLDDALSRGAHVVGQAEGVPDAGRFFPPTALAGITEDMLVSQQETFGPLAPILRFESEAEAIRIANATKSGLASYFYTTDIRRAWRVAEELEFGMVGLNTGAIAIEVAPFGGIKQSGLGREGGREGLDEYLETKAFHWAGLDRA